MTSLNNQLSIILLLSICHYLTFAASPRSVGDQKGPRVTIRPDQDILLLETSTVNKVLTCTTNGQTPGMFSQLRWSGPNRQDNWEELSKRHKVRETTRGGYSLELEFQRPSPDDSGIYYCTGIYQSSDLMNDTIKITVYNPIRLENCPDRQFVVEGSNSQKITCRVTGDELSLVVFKDDVPLDHSNPRYRYDNEDSVEILAPASKQDAGIYRIEITSELTGTRENKEIQVEVHSKPEFPLNATSEFSAVEGEPVELKCDVTGNPQPLVYWLDPRLRNSSSLGGYFANPEKGTLLISKTNRVDDHGEFTCIAKNTVGDATRKIPLNVMQRPNIYAFENKTVEEGTEAYFECRATGYPKPTFSIRRHGLNQTAYRVGDGYVTDVREDLEGGGAPGYVYRIKLRADRSQFGLHYCNATNKAGSSERVGLLAVKHRPDLSLTPVVQYVKLGKNVTVVCHIKAYPEPKVSWFNENGQQILNAPVTVKSLADGQTHVVTMQPPPSLVANVGKYKCMAQNEIGEPSEIFIQTHFTTVPGPVNAVVLESTPTTVKLQLGVINDGGDRVREYKYRAEGITMDNFNPFVDYPLDKQNETSIEALPSPSVYVIRNLLPYYRYRISIKAVNDVGDGDLSEMTVETRKPTAPGPPVIIKPTVGLSSSQLGFTSDYQNGYLLKWSPPDLDNGDLITKYIIKIYKIRPEMPDVIPDDSDTRVIEQVNERPFHARIGPLETNEHYRIDLQARNKYGDSEPARIIITTSANRPMMPDFGPQALTWLTEPTTPVLVGLLILAICCLIIIDIIFCACFQMGVTYTMRNLCCPAKANSVISDKTYT